jgi:hypothetical protein
MELNVLQGFGEYLQGFDNIKVECSEPPIYEGGASASEVIEFLENCGFVQDSDIVRHGDVKFKRRK